VVYFAVFGAGIAYMLKLMATPALAGEPDPPHLPQRAAGITPAAGVAAPDAGEDRP
ncbi:MAG: cytochrome ubiquinol oxidase subunit I, partial [Proteobacteria bacterium]|nr:cytochrome ubiquinol oxidase subunit I [Pseudomonadota bacterium]